MYYYHETQIDDEVTKYQFLCVRWGRLL